MSGPDTGVVCLKDALIIILILAQLTERNTYCDNRQNICSSRNAVTCDFALHMHTFINVHIYCVCIVIVLTDEKLMLIKKENFEKQKL